MTSGEINEAICTIENNKIDEEPPHAPASLRASGKNIPYYGWFWRNVDFDRPITLAYANGDGFDTPGWVGFCENNKWGYQQWTATVEQTTEIRTRCERYANSPSKETAGSVFDYLQAIRPAYIDGTSRWDDECEQ
jgi:hypothetical protein